MIRTGCQSSILQVFLYLSKISVVELKYCISRTEDVQTIHIRSMTGWVGCWHTNIALMPFTWAGFDPASWQQSSPIQRVHRVLCPWPGCLRHPGMKEAPSHVHLCNLELVMASFLEENGNLRGSSIIEGTLLHQVPMPGLCGPAGSLSMMILLHQQPRGP